VFADDACNGGTNPNFFGMQNVGSILSCFGGYNAIYDMSGNAEEWEDACTGTGANDSCAARGGNRTDSSAALQCTGSKVTTRTLKSNLRGFRCCAD
jgi:hypothetical protein